MLKEECKKYFDEVVSKLEAETPESDLQTFKERFEFVSKIHKFENGYIYVVVKDALNKILIEKFSSRRMNELLESICNEKVGFKFITE